MRPQRIQLFLVSFAAALAFAVAGCSSTGSYTSSARFETAVTGAIEQREISYQGIHRNPVIVIHGFLGSSLIDRKTKANYWGEFSGMDSVALSHDRIKGLALPMQLGKSLNDLQDDTVPNGMLDSVTVNILGVSFTKNAYIDLINLLEEGGFQPEGKPLAPDRDYCTLFQFSYDWRRDLQWNAKKLHEYILRKRAYLKTQYEIHHGVKDYDVQFDIIAHSMGGLLARYYLRYGTADLPPRGKKPDITWFGSKYVDRIILLGTPNAGYLDTILEMTQGTSIPAFSPALLGTWPTYYQMLPNPYSRSVVYARDHESMVDIFDPAIWVKMKWGLADPSQKEYLRLLLPDVPTDAQRRRIALDHLRKCLERAQRFVEVMEIPAVPPEDIKLYLVLGNAVMTTRRAAVNAKTGELSVITYAPGDGKVTTASALFDYRAGSSWSPFFSSPIAWRGIIRLRAAHMGITSDPAFKDNVLFLLNAVPSERQKREAFGR